jgi:hypothetical protein
MRSLPVVTVACVTWAALSAAAAFEAASRGSSGVFGVILLLVALVASGAGGYRIGRLGLLPPFVGTAAVAVAGAVPATPPSDFDEAWALSITTLLFLEWIAVGAGAATRRRKRDGRPPDPLGSPPKA